MRKVKIKREKFDGIVRAFGVFFGDALEFEVPENLAHFFVRELGYEVIRKRGRPPKTEKEEAK